jgi:hypothetical protein
MGQVAARGAVADALAIHVQNETVIGAHPNGISGWDRIEREEAAEMEHLGFAQRRGGVSDPGGVPFAV